MYAHVQLMLEDGDDAKEATFNVGGATLTAHGGKDGKGIGVTTVPVSNGATLGEIPKGKKLVDENDVILDKYEKAVPFGAVLLEPGMKAVPEDAVILEPGQKAVKDRSS
jgi:hypothetical protein